MFARLIIKDLKHSYAPLFLAKSQTSSKRSGSTCQHTTRLIENPALWPFMASTQKIKRTTRKEPGSQEANCGWEISFRSNCRRLGSFFMDITPMSLSNLRPLGCETRHRIFSAGYGWKERYWITISCNTWGRQELTCIIGLWNSSNPIHCS